MPMTGKALVFLLACAAAYATERVQTVPLLQAPLAPVSPALNQLRLDLAAASVKLDAASPLQNVIAAVPRAAQAPVATDAIRRLQVANQILLRYDAENFAKLPEADQAQALSAMWDGWKMNGLLGAEKSQPAMGKLDALVLEGVRDARLTSANKSVFLGAAVLGYPLADSLWLSRNRISDALDENALIYPRDQGWVNASGTPEFLGVSPLAQPLVDRWSQAARHAAAVVRQVRKGSRELPLSKVVTKEATAGLARVASELLAAGDTEALDYLESRQDPTFSAFLLDAGKPGYYLYNGAGGVVARVLATRAAGTSGVRRLDQPEMGTVVPSTYYYRPARVVARLAALLVEPADHAEKERDLFSQYAARAGALGVKEPKGDVKGWTFSEPEFLEGSALDSARNRLTSYGEGTKGSFSRYDLPLKAGALRSRLASGEAIPSLAGERWDSAADLFKASGALSKAGDDVEVRLVSERFQTRDALVAKGQGSVLVQVFALDELARLKKTDKKAARAFLRFLAAAVDAALR